MIGWAARSVQSRPEHQANRKAEPRKSVIPAKAGIHFNHESLWIPAFAGMTGIGRKPPYFAQ